MKYTRDASILARERKHSPSVRARFEARVSDLSADIAPLVRAAMAQKTWPDWFQMQMKEHGQAIMSEEADSLARQTLTYFEQMGWLLPDVDEGSAMRHAASHVARSRGFQGHHALVAKLEQGLAASPAVA